LMDELRSGRRECDEAVVATLLRASDVLADHIQAARGAGAAVDAPRTAVLVAELEALIGGPAAAPAVAPEPEPEVDPFGFQPVQFDESSLSGGTDGPAVWRIVFRPRAALYAKANETGLIL